MFCHGKTSRRTILRFTRAERSEGTAVGASATAAASGASATFGSARRAARLDHRFIRGSARTGKAIAWELLSFHRLAKTQTIAVTIFHVEVPATVGLVTNVACNLHALRFELDIKRIGVFDPNIVVPGPALRINNAIRAHNSGAAASYAGHGPRS